MYTSWASRKSSKASAASNGASTSARVAMARVAMISTIDVAANRSDFEAASRAGVMWQMAIVIAYTVMARCIVANGGKKSLAIIKSCNGKEAVWLWGKNNVLRSKLTGLCLNVQGGNKGKPGSPIVLATCDGKRNQRWAHGPHLSIRSKVSNNCLDVKGNSVGQFSPVVLNGCFKVANQKWIKMAAPREFIKMNSAIGIRSVNGRFIQISKTGGIKLVHKARTRNAELVVSSMSAAASPFLQWRERVVFRTVHGTYLQVRSLLCLEMF